MERMLQLLQTTVLLVRWDWCPKDPACFLYPCFPIAVPWCVKACCRQVLVFSETGKMLKLVEAETHSCKYTALHNSDSSFCQSFLHKWMLLYLDLTLVGVQLLRTKGFWLFTPGPQPRLEALHGTSSGTVFLFSMLDWWVPGVLWSISLYSPRQLPCCFNFFSLVDWVQTLTARDSAARPWLPWPASPEVSMRTQVSACLGVWGGWGDTFLGGEAAVQGALTGLDCSEQPRLGPPRTPAPQVWVSLLPQLWCRCAISSPLCPWFPGGCWACAVATSGSFCSWLDSLDGPQTWFVAHHVQDCWWMLGHWAQTLRDTALLVRALPVLGSPLAPESASLREQLALNALGQ